MKLLIDFRIAVQSCGEKTSAGEFVGPICGLKAIAKGRIIRNI